MPHQAPGNLVQLPAYDAKTGEPTAVIETPQRQPKQVRL